MEIFKQAAKEKLRFETSKGFVTVEQLFDLNITALTRIIKNLKKELSKDNDDELSFLDETSAPVNKKVTLQFNIAKEVYLERKKENEDAAEALAKKEARQKAIEEKARRQEKAITTISDDELEAIINQK
ncbi:hypothetical protein Phi4:1_gp193 [Cellulophaga phage phi4:1]|uniref:Uncharacterized protein n=5 Tax=Lightbulbvirus TaxID=1918522 RepID=A0A0S2MWV1_9CAUD|nr:hypothetical protein Phi4:1_gp193 [Cellulophaga phage phi4:1]YP_008241689.1 hypothetical protein Phi17:2_gp194 [Cellulophaga phage phi17:2]ALO80202.1 hypothetical protein Phi4113_193 [Cellulophaga phage phi4:1_13]ALO80399.1 hypothetical protein Phi4118_193 [Cellulophaga phage phi4:1_18]ALO80597.1 hypothetical protein Phi17218_194 [Cellulophaga phage phi17:2_18]AGO47727.1 hypothetical protein Phi17:2_gp194 [Cellulophaga phage phi17:2]AGO49606.1 hypothetical protein Phi4:1_gp193 [Cellulophag